MGIGLYSLCHTQQGAIYRVKAFDIRWFYGYELYLGISPEGHGMEWLQSIGCVR